MDDVSILRWYYSMPDDFRRAYSLSDFVLALFIVARGVSIVKRVLYGSNEPGAEPDF